MPLTHSKEARAVLIILSVSLVVHLLSLVALPENSFLYPAAAVGTAALFFGGLSLWPIVFLGILLGELLVEPSSVLSYLLPFVLTAQAVFGAYILRGASVDPLFRRYRDTAYLIATAFLAGGILPTFFTFLSLVDASSLPDWGNVYIASVFSVLVIVPFLLRWYAKPSFRRSRTEGLETLAALGAIVLIDIAYFGLGIKELFDLSLVYFLFIPLLWTAIRLRPRFVTLAVLITSGFALWDALRSDPSGAQLPEAQWLMITLSILLYIIVSLEEDRRVNTNLLRSQLSTLENAFARISSESRAKNNFIAILAHELRNPLAPVVSAIDHMKLTSSNPDERQTLTMMEESMTTVKRLLDDLLDVSRITEGKIELKRERLALIDVIQRSVLSTEHYFKERHQALVFKNKQKLYVDGDAVRLEQVFSNLLTNASKYSNSGDTISISVKKTGDAAEVHVIDEGIGIEASWLDTIFLPFHQLDSGARHKKGLGIGLALVQSFVHMHDGTVEALSRGKGRGSTFIVRLPLSKDTALSGGTDLERAPLERSQKHVLVVDDNDAAAAGIGRLLEHWGCAVQYAYTGKTAVEKGRRGNFDAIILDVGLPDLDGYAVARKLRESGYSGALIGLSGYSTPDAKEKGTAAGFDEYLVKPAGLSELRSALS